MNEIAIEYEKIKLQICSYPVAILLALYASDDEFLIRANANTNIVRRRARVHDVRHRAFKRKHVKHGSRRKEKATWRRIVAYGNRMPNSHKRFSPLKEAGFTADCSQSLGRLLLPCASRASSHYSRKILYNVVTNAHDPGPGRINSGVWVFSRTYTCILYSLYPARVLRRRERRKWKSDRRRNVCARAKNLRTCTDSLRGQHCIALPPPPKRSSHSVAVCRTRARGGLLAAHMYIY
jgi:hypothetical protein